ncbi:hypothetical protein CN918_28365 [Priestia megaterium]|nr:hypothetical protein CN918_28365 [Priestia megaterium]
MWKIRPYYDVAAAIILLYVVCTVVYTDYRVSFALTLIGILLLKLSPKSRIKTAAKVFLLLICFLMMLAILLGVAMAGLVEFG